ncbi:M20 family peptidase [Aerococcus agrisoli]|uniref:M20 family peptidase n=1 Tax=Aerococcus agrisoli TaxID=2487350 RepID=A0A3N4G8Q6_9LACT|nr:M20 family peptidase [Aerococcus agrisoli]
MDSKALNERIKAQEADMIDFLKQLVNTESGIEQIDGVNKIGRILADACQSIGMKTRTIKHDQAGDMVIAEFTPDQPQSLAPIVLSGHMDTVFEAGVTQEHGFRWLDEAAGLAQGAGIMDMKGGLVIAFYVAKNLIELGYQDHPIKLIFVPDEETLHRHSDSRNEMLAELQDAHSLLNFEPSESLDKLVVSRKGGMMLAVTVEGIAGHSGMEADKGRSAIVELAQKVVALEAKTDISRHKLINCGLFNGGVSANTIPGFAKGNFSLRFPNEAIKQEILNDLDAVVNQTYIEGTTTTYTIESGVDAMEWTDKVDGLLKHYQTVAKSIGYGTITAMESQGASDASIATQADIPVLDGLGVVGSGAHTLTETADLTSLVPKVCLSIHAIAQLS